MTRAHRFGSCCSSLRDALTSEQFNRLINVNEDGVLFMSIGYTKVSGDRTGWFDRTILYCPFCGTQLQTAEELALIKQKVRPS